MEHFDALAILNYARAPESGPSLTGQSNTLLASESKKLRGGQNLMTIEKRQELTTVVFMKSIEYLIAGNEGNPTATTLKTWEENKITAFSKQNGPRKDS